MNQPKPISFYEKQYGDAVIETIKKKIDFFPVKSIAKEVGLATSTIWCIAQAIYEDRGYERLPIEEVIIASNSQIRHAAERGMTCREIFKWLKDNSVTTRISSREIAKLLGSKNSAKDTARNAEQIAKMNKKRERLANEATERKRKKEERKAIEQAKAKAKAQKDFATEEQIRRKAMAILEKERKAQKAHETLISRIANDLRKRRLSPDDAESVHGKEKTQEAIQQLGGHGKLNMLQDVERPRQLSFIRENWQLPDPRLAFFLDTSIRQIQEARKRIEGK